MFSAADLYFPFLLFLILIWICLPLALAFLVSYLTQPKPLSPTDHLAHCRKCDALVDYRVVTECPYCAAQAYRLDALDINK
jgi:hypothetical protein